MMAEKSFTFSAKNFMQNSSSGRLSETNKLTHNICLDGLKNETGEN